MIDDIDASIDEMIAKIKAAPPSKGKPGYGYTLTRDDGSYTKYVILGDEMRAKAFEIVKERGDKSLLMYNGLEDGSRMFMTPFETQAVPGGEIHTYSELEYIQPVRDSVEYGSGTWERLSKDEIPECYHISQEEADRHAGITAADRKEMEQRHRLSNALETLIKNRGKRYPKGFWTEELEDEPSFRFEDATNHTCWFDHFTGFEALYRLRRYSDEIAEAWETDTPLAEPVKFSFGKWGSEACTYCGTHEFLTDGFKIWAEQECPYPDGIPCEIVLDVPSGTVVIGNDFRDKFPGKTSDHFNVNATYGIAAAVKDYEADKMAHFFVGNSCPGVYVTGKNELMIANSPNEDDGEVVDGKWISRENPKYTEWLEDKEEIGGVCTDLWWVSMVDQAEAESRGMDTAKENGPGWTEYIHFECEPGRYVITFNGMMKGFDRDSKDEVVYATMRRISDVPSETE